MRRFLLYGGLAFLLGALYVAGVFVYRRIQDSEYFRRQGVVAAPAPVPSVIANQGGEVRILQFYAVAGAISKGAGTNICYGVQNAREVRLTPPVEEVEPALTRCFAIAPERTTTYKLTAVGKDGREVAAEFTVKVR
ncbi:MAG TPA: hypothetical protein VHA11_03055 [Bryobacteraceae bacterium]|nr:hypothetical protein [Bryobacteraceae bacterium]